MGLNITTGEIYERMSRIKTRDASRCGRILFLLLTFVLVIQVPLEKPSLMSCPSRLFLSMPCPLCGLTHALRSFFLFDLKNAILFNPLVLLVGPGLLYLVIDTMYLFRYNRPLVRHWPARLKQIVGWTFAGLFIFVLFIRLFSVLWPGLNPQGFFIPP